MLAKLVTRVVKLDYTTVAEPLTFDQIHNDITEVEIKYFGEPDEIVLWGHQWDWLVKSLPSERIRAEYILSLHEEPVSTIWGVPVTVKS